MPVRAPLSVAGFTATDEPSLAAGCDPDPDPDRWAGYERYIPENLLAVDLFTGESTGRAEPTVKHQVSACLREFGVPSRARLIAALR